MSLSIFGGGSVYPYATSSSSTTTAVASGTTEPAPSAGIFLTQEAFKITSPTGTLTFSNPITNVNKLKVKLLHYLIPIDGLSKLTIKFDNYTSITDGANAVTIVLPLYNISESLLVYENTNANSFDYESFSSVATVSSLDYTVYVDDVVATASHVSPTNYIYALLALS